MSAVTALWPKWLRASFVIRANVQIPPFTRLRCWHSDCICLVVMSGYQQVSAASLPARGIGVVKEGLSRAASFITVLTLLVLGTTYVLSRDSVADPDIWWHLHNAQYLFQQHHLPNKDAYSFTVPGHAWMNHEWLGEIPYYLGWRAFGLAGIQATELLVLSGIFLGLLYLCYQETGNYKAATGACCFSVFLASVSFGPRTILFGYFYLTILLIILQRYRLRQRAPLWAIPLLFCAWINTHGSWSLGIIVLTASIAAGFVEGKWGSIEAHSWTTAQRRSLVLTWIASCAALFVNPYGFKLVIYPLDMAFRQTLNISHVAEWVSVNFHDTRGKVVLVLLISLLVSALWRRTRWTLAEVALVLFALYSGLTYIRFLVLLGIVVAPILARVLSFLPEYRRELDTPMLNAAVIVLAVAAAVHYWPTSEQLGRSVASRYPVAAMTYMKDHAPAAPMLNFYLWGGYIPWVDSRTKVFLDSRVDIFEYEGVLKDYLDATELKNPEAILDKYRVQSVLFPPGEALTYVLEHDPGWRATYRDPVCVLLERNPPGVSEHAMTAINQRAAKAIPRL